MMNMENYTLISVIVPVYKTERYLRRCMDSLCNQTYGSLEIIAINDGSPDNSLTILNEYASKDKRVVIINKENGGANSARNLALSRAKGYWISFVDSDDWLDYDYFQELMKNTTPDSQLICGGFRINETGQAYKTKVNHISMSRIDSLETLYDTYFGMLYNVWGKVFRRDVIINNKLQFKSFLRHDGIFLMEYFSNINSINIISTDCFLHYNTDNSNSLTHKLFGIENMMLDLYSYYIAYTHLIELDYPNYTRYMHILNSDKSISFCNILHETYPLPYKEKIYWYRRMISELPEFILSKYLQKPIHKWLKIAFNIRCSYFILCIIEFHLLLFRVRWKFRL